MQSQSTAPGSGVGNRVAFGCLALFAFPFLGGGVLALVQGLRHYPKEQNAMVGIIVGGVFTMVALFLLGGAAYALVSSARTQALQTQNPQKPWMWRDDWAHGVVRDRSVAPAVGLWIFALIWNAIAFPIALLTGPSELSKGNWAVLLVLLFPLVGIILVISAVYRTLRTLKFGTSTCHLEHVPIAPGRTVRGDIEVRTEASPQNGYHLRIASIRAVTSGTGKNRSTSELVQWDTEIVVDAAAAMRSPMGTRVPFAFATPPDAHGTDASDSNDRYFWRLSATAELPGVDYAAQFELPIFQTGEAIDGSDFAAYEQRHRSEAARHGVAAASGVRLQALPGGGEQFEMGAKKTVVSTLKALLFLAIWNAAVVAMIYFRLPWLLIAFFVGFDLLLIVGAVDYFAGRSTVAVDRSGVRVRRTWLGRGSMRSYDADTIDSIDSSNAGNNTAFGVTMKLKDGTSRVLSQYLPDRESADTVAAKMMADLGRV